MTKVPVNFRIDSELLALARARSERDGITLIALLERSLKSALEVSALAAPSDQIKVNLTDVETFVKTITESVNTIKAEVTGLSDKLNLVSATVDTIVNTSAVNTVVKSNVNTNEAIDDPVTSTANSSKEWLNLATVAAELEVLPKSISGAASKRGRDIGNNTIEFKIAGKTICKKGSGITALYQVHI